jgi:murein DD-endopeptidase MepM/ murein hydrolase activator NlpD
MAKLAIALWIVLSCGTALAGGPLSFALPLDCQPGKTCVLQNYVDRDPGPGARDYRCGHLAYDGHKGTDIRVIDLPAFKRGVPVLAAAPGRVRAVRDGMPDVSVRDPASEPVAGREAGNSVVIEHGEGWETQYAHLRKGSVAVRAGERIEGGQPLGMAGLSGNTEFPHLHFEVRYRGRTVDPFVGLDLGAAAERCEPGRNPLWTAQTLGALAYVPTGLLGAGLSASPPRLTDGSVDPDRIEPLNASSGAAVFWMQVYGVQKDDVEELRLLAPDGRVLAERRTSIVRNRAQSLSYIGLRRSAAAWPKGTYRGEYVLYRGSPRQKIISFVREASVAANGE